MSQQTVIGPIGTLDLRNRDEFGDSFGEAQEEEYVKGVLRIERGHDVLIRIWISYRLFRQASEDWISVLVSNLLKSYEEYEPSTPDPA